MLYTYEVEAGTPEEAEELVRRDEGEIVGQEFDSDFGVELDDGYEAEEVNHQV
jgi:hypothetical protein